MVDYISILQRVLILLEFNVEFRKIHADKDSVHICAKIGSQDLSTIGKGRTHTDAKQKAARGMLIKVFEMYHSEILTSLHVDKIDILRNENIDPPVIDG